MHNFIVKYNYNTIPENFVLIILSIHFQSICGAKIMASAMTATMTMTASKISIKESYSKWLETPLRYLLAIENIRRFRKYKLF